MYDCLNRSILVFLYILLFLIQNSCIYSLYHDYDSLEHNRKLKSNNKKVNVGRKIVENFIYYIPTSEGLISHVRQADIIWNMALSVNRSIRIINFKSIHYPDIDTVNLCNIFYMRDIQCLDVNPDSIREKYQCVDTAKTRDFNYANVECISGAINREMGLHPPTDARARFLEEPIFRVKYLDLLPSVKNALGISDGKPYAVVHWRRGDQLSHRCAKSDDDSRPRIDHTVNCKSVETLYSTILSNQKKFCDIEDPKQLVTYVATNEVSDKSLKFLTSKHLKIFSDLRNNKKLRKLNLTILEEFIIELMLMCDANYLFAWGESSIHGFAYNCRKYDKIKKKNTVINDVSKQPHAK